ncbi:MAG: ATP-binding protein [Caulobacterales bacterium]
MASVTATARSERAKPAGDSLWPPGSRLGRLIVVLNLLALAVLVGGALVLNEMRTTLVKSREQSLLTEGKLIANVIGQFATAGDPEPALDASQASDILQSLDISGSERVRLWDADGHMIADSYVVADRVERSELPPARKPGEKPFVMPGFPMPPRKVDTAQKEVGAALRGETQQGVRVSENGARVVSVSIPLQRVAAVVGVLTLESGDVDEIIAGQRVALIPFIVIAVLVNLLSSFVLTQMIAQPVRRLARAADSVRLSRARAIALPDLADRKDELGDLARSLEDMTHALSERMQAIERFAADVAHEIRNPLTSIRSAVETLGLVKDDAARQRLMGIVQQDVRRLDRLITDISNASRLDAELSRESPRPADLARLLHDIVAVYEAGLRAGEVRVRMIEPGGGPFVVSGREGPLGQVFRNLIDNARSFSEADAEVRVSVSRDKGRVIVAVEDDGPGMPPESLETVFERFYTSRPKGAAFGGNSGLGLSIARQIVEAHAGEIHAENRLDAERGVVGARFVVALPEARSPS